MAKPIYLDYAAATPVDERVFNAMRPYFSENFYNPSSSYLAGRQVKARFEDARHRVAQVLGARPAEIIFTAGATESINLAIHSVMQAYAGTEMVTIAIEHEAVLAPIRKHKGKIVDVQPNGSVDVARLEKTIVDNTVLVSVGYANNEVGTVQPIKDIAQMIARIRADRRKRGVTVPLFLHIDASQAAAYLDLHVSRLGVDYMTLNAGKIYGPKQVGMLFAKAGVPLHPIVMGGGQESNIRSGTQNVAGVMGFATALELAANQRKEAIETQTAQRDTLQKLICDALPDTWVNGNQKKRLPNNLHLSWDGVDGERLVMLLDERGVMASTGSACAANKNTGSHVLPALGLSPSLVAGSLRLTVGRPTTDAEILAAADIIVQSVKELKTVQ